MQLLLSVALLALVFGRAHARLPDVIATDKGNVLGDEDLLQGVQIWRGIPFAASPTGENRLRPPQPAVAWTKTLDCKAGRSICPQFNLIGDLHIGDEDCLYLNVFVPPGTTNTSNLTVMFWIFGGGWTLGDGDEFGLYEGIHLAMKHNVVVVTHNYRLAAFGFLALKQAIAEEGTTGNYALQDQRAALLWTQRNIRNFGGNPDNVMIFGESAGAFSVCHHLVNPLSKGLFTSAIMESGTCEAPEFFLDLADAVDFSEGYAAELGCDSATVGDAGVMPCLRALSADKFIRGLKGYPYAGRYQPRLAPGMPWAAAIDGSAQGLQDVPLNLIKKNKWAQVPVIAGTNKNEGDIFILGIGLIVPGVHVPLDAASFQTVLLYFFANNQTLVNDITLRYPTSDYSGHDGAASAVLRDYFFACSARRNLRAITDLGFPGWLYHFTYKGDFIESPFLGDYHSAELPYVWSNAWPPLVHPFLPDDEKMADTFGAYWSNFAKDHDPNGATVTPKLLNWPRLTRADDTNIVMSVPTVLQAGLYSGNCDFWDLVGNP